MHVSSIRYGRKINTGNYQSLDLSIEVALEEGDSPTEAFEKARKLVEFEAKKG
jgi:hypothetical protein